MSAWDVLAPFVILAGIVAPVVVGQRRGVLTPETGWLQRLPWSAPSLLLFVALFVLAAVGE